MTEQEVKDYVLSHMAKHKVPRYVEFVDRVPDERRGKDPQVQNARELRWRNSPFRPTAPLKPLNFGVCAA